MVRPISPDQSALPKALIWIPKYRNGKCDKNAVMTRLLDQAIAKVRELPDEEQDALALTLLSMTDAEASVLPLDDETRAAIREGLAQARRGEFVPDQEIEALWKRYGL